MKKYIVAIDLGGMSAKGAVFTLDDTIIYEQSVCTCSKDGYGCTLQSLADLTEDLLKNAGVEKGQVLAIGMGRPG